jgi:hypothetical protein
MTEYKLKAPWFDSGMASDEKLFTEMGAPGYARLIAKHLREPSPHREILDSVARLLDPRPGDQLELIIRRRRPGRVLKGVKRYDDLKIALAFGKSHVVHLSAGKPSYGAVKAAVADTATKLGVTEREVRGARSRMRRLIPK